MDMYQKREIRENKKNNENKKSLPSTNINYYPGHMAKTKRQIKENLELIDIVYEIIDARIPMSSKINDINDLIKNKIRILIMTKKDLCNLEKTLKWQKYYEEKGYKVLLIDLKDNNDYKKIIDLTKKLTAEIQTKRANKGLKSKEIKALVIGIPNVGKSTLINKMAGKKVANVENKPGVTKNLRFLPTNFGITLLDTPGILWPKFEDQNVAMNIACVGSIKKEVLNIVDCAIYILGIYEKYYPSVIKDIYKIDNRNPISMLESLSAKWGFCKQEEIDYTKTSERIYNDLVSGKIKGITLDI